MTTKHPDTQTRKQAEKLGRRAEWLCRLALMLKGYRVRASRLRVRAGEIDILATKATRYGPVLVVVEVKARVSADQAIGAVSTADWRRLARAAQQAQASRPWLAGHSVRFDLMLVLPGRWPIHHIDVWQPGA